MLGTVIATGGVIGALYGFGLGAEAAQGFNHAAGMATLGGLGGIFATFGVMGVIGWAGVLGLGIKNKIEKANIIKELRRQMREELEQSRKEGREELKQAREEGKEYKEENEQWLEELKQAREEGKAWLHEQGKEENQALTVKGLGILDKISNAANTTQENKVTQISANKPKFS